MRTFLAVCVLLLAASASASDPKQSLEISGAAPPSAFKCFKKSGIDYVFVRVFKSDGQGSYDATAAGNVHNANMNSLGVSAFMVPQLFSKKSAAAQVQETLDNLVKDGVNMRGLYVQVTNPGAWSANQTANTVFIKSILTAIRQNNVNLGVFTNSADWNTITGMTDLMDTFPMVYLWYSNVGGDGQQGESSNDVSDFVPFAGWTSPYAKRYAQNESVCGVRVNKNTINPHWTPQQGVQALRSERGMVIVQ